MSAMYAYLCETSYHNALLSSLLKTVRSKSCRSRIYIYNIYMIN